MIDLLILRQASIIIASLLGSYTDIKTGYIYDWITLPLIGIGVILNLIEWNLIGIGLGIIVFVIGYALYYTGKLGGGDVKLYTGITLTLPFYANGIFILSVVILSALSAIVFLASYFMIKYFRKGINFKYNEEGIKKAILFLAIITIYFFVLAQSNIVSSAYILILGVPLLFGIVFVAFEKGIRKEFFLKKIKLSEMEEDEIIAFDFMDKKIETGFKGIFGEKEKKELEKKGIKEIFVYRNLPRFGAFIFIGVIIAIAFPEFGFFISNGGFV